MRGHSWPVLRSTIWNSSSIPIVNGAAIVLLLPRYVRLTFLNASVYYWHHTAITAFNLYSTIFSQSSSEVEGRSCFVVACNEGKAEGNIYQQGSIKFSLIQRVRISQALQTSRPGGTATQKSFALILFTTASN